MLYRIDHDPRAARYIIIYAPERFGFTAGNYWIGFPRRQGFQHMRYFSRTSTPADDLDLFGIKSYQPSAGTYTYYVKGFGAGAGHSRTATTEA